MDAILTETLASAGQLAEDAVRAAWAEAGGPQHEYLAHLAADIRSSFEALGDLREAVRAAWQDEERASAVRTAVLSEGARLGLRAQLTLEVARTAARTMKVLAGAGQQELAGMTLWKQWRCSSWPRPPDERTCHWCRLLNGMVIPLHDDFPPGDPADLTGHGRVTVPPRVYMGQLKGPPRHPRCRCGIEILTALPEQEVASVPGGQGVTPAIAPQGPVRSRAAGALQHPAPFLAAQDIRDMPEDSYEALLHFLKAAAHELRQALARLRRIAK